MLHSVSNTTELFSLLRQTAAKERFVEVLLAHDDQNAKIYLQDGMVIWAIASGQRESFQSLVLEEHLATRDELLQVIQESRSLGRKNLNDILIALGIGDSSTREDIIRRHTRAAFDILKRWDECKVRLFPLPHAAQTSSSGFSLDEFLNGSIPQQASNIPSKPLTVLPSALTSESATQGEPIHAAQQQDKEAPGNSLPAATVNQPLAVEVPKDKIRPAVEPHTSRLHQLLEQLCHDTPDTQFVGIIDTETGIPVEFVGKTAGLDIDMISAFCTQTLRATSQLITSAAGMSPFDKQHTCESEEILISSADRHIFLRWIHANQSLLFHAMDRGSNPGLSRVVVRKILEELRQLI